jgi:chromosome segregation ATPase
VFSCICLCLQASALRVRLADSRKEQDKLKALLDSVAGERNAALSQVSALERELATIKTLLNEMQQRAEEYRNEVRVLCVSVRVCVRERARVCMRVCMCFASCSHVRLCQKHLE